MYCDVIIGYQQAAPVGYQQRPTFYPQQQQPSFAAGQQQQQDPSQLKKKTTPKWPVYPASTAGYHFSPEQQFYLPQQYYQLPSRDYYAQPKPQTVPSDAEFPAVLSAIGSLASSQPNDPLIPRRPYHLAVNKRIFSQLSGGVKQTGPLVAYLAKPSSQLALARDGQVDQQVIEQAALNDGPFVYLYPTDDRK